jgi:hypothetical protein
MTSSYLPQPSETRSRTARWAAQYLGAMVTDAVDVASRTREYDSDWDVQKLFQSLDAAAVMDEHAVLGDAANGHGYSCRVIARLTVRSLGALIGVSMVTA